MSGRCPKGSPSTSRAVSGSRTRPVSSRASPPASWWGRGRRRRRRSSPAPTSARAAKPVGSRSTRPRPTCRLAPRYRSTELLRDVEGGPVEAVAELDVAPRAAALHLEGDRVVRVYHLQLRRGGIGDDRAAVRAALDVAEVGGAAVAGELLDQVAVQAVLDGLRLVGAGAVVREQDDAVVQQLMAVLRAAPR